MGLATEARYSIRPPPEVCVVDLDINYLYVLSPQCLFFFAHLCMTNSYRNCASPPPGAVSVKQQREKFRQRLLAAFEPDYHPDHCVPV
jgi:EEF1A N-terminal glycine/lysine methyltransferase